MSTQDPKNTVPADATVPMPAFDPATQQSQPENGAQVVSGGGGGRDTTWPEAEHGPSRPNGPTTTPSTASGEPAMTPSGRAAALREQRRQSWEDHRPRR